MEIRINSLADINEAAKQFIANMGNGKVFAFYGKMGAKMTPSIPRRRPRALSRPMRRTLFRA